MWQHFFIQSEDELLYIADTVDNGETTVGGGSFWWLSQSLSIFPAVNNHAKIFGRRASQKSWSCPFGQATSSTLFSFRFKIDCTHSYKSHHMMNLSLLIQNIFIPSMYKSYVMCKCSWPTLWLGGLIQRMTRLSLVIAWCAMVGFLVSKWFICLIFLNVT